MFNRSLLLAVRQVHYHSLMRRGTEIMHVLLLPAVLQLFKALPVAASPASGHHVHVLNAFPYSRSVSVAIPGVNPSTLNYSQTTTLISPHLDSTSKATIGGGGDTVEEEVDGPTTSASIGFLVVEPSLNSEKLSSSFHMWETESSRLDSNKSYFVIRNSFDRKDIDVIIFSAKQHAAGNTSLFRLIRNMGRRQSRAVPMAISSGVYEMKIVSTDSVSNVTEFKNAISYVEPLVFQAVPGQRYFTAMIGLTGNTDQYKPRLASIPPLKQVLRPSVPHTHLYVINVYASDHDVLITFDEQEFPRLTFGAVLRESLYLARGLKIRVTTGAEKFEFSVMESVPFAAADCITVIKERPRSKREIQQPHFRCYPKPRVNSTQAIVYVYNSVYNHTQGIDIVAMPNTQNSTIPLMFIAQSLTFGASNTATVDAQQYTVKVVSAGTVTNREEFEAAPSFIQLMDILPQGGVHYYTSLHGIQGSTRPMYKIHLDSYPDINLPEQSTTRPQTPAAGHSNIASSTASDQIQDRDQSDNEGEEGTQNSDNEGIKGRQNSASLSGVRVLFIVSLLASFYVSSCLL